MPRRKPSTPDARAAKVLIAVRAGAHDDHARDFAGLTEHEWQDWMDGDFGLEVAQAKRELAIFAAGTVRRAVASSPAVAARIAERAHGEAELRRLDAISGVGR